MINNEIHHDNTAKNTGDVWHLLHWEREALCEALLGNEAAAAFDHAPTSSFRRRSEQVLEARLRLIDDALDRLMAGSYGDCVKCGKWIEDTKLHIDPAFPFCHACEPQKLGSVTKRLVMSDHEVIAW